MSKALPLCLMTVFVAGLPMGSALANALQEDSSSTRASEKMLYLREGTAPDPSDTGRRHRTVPNEAWNRILQVLSRYPGAVVEESADRLLIDESKIGSEGVRQQLGAASGDAPRAGGADGAGTEALCIRTPFGPGWVNWGMSFPASYGYSVKPESTWSLVWAYAPGQNCDGIYNRWWGCGFALKVPDSCTAYIDAYGNISCCCNAALAQLGYVCQWVNPGSPAVGWPNCPL